MIRAKFFTRTALGLSLALGLAAGAASPVLAKDKDKKPAEVKLSPSKGFVPAYVAAKTALDAAAKRPDVVAARQAALDAKAAADKAQSKKAIADTSATLSAAQTILGNLLQPEKALVEKAVAAGTTADDKEISGQLLIYVGSISLDPVLQRRGIQMRIDSGKNPASEIPRFYLALANIAFESKDYASTQTLILKAKELGYTGSEGEVMLADSMIKGNRAPEGLKVLHDLAVRTGAAAPENWLSYGARMAYKAKLPQEGAYFASALVQAYPSQDNWTLAIVVVRDLNQFQGHDQIDLLRLMERTKSYSEARDYVDYIQALSKRGMPGEELKIINQGVASGMLSANDQFVIDGKKEATTRIASDRASLPAQEREARGPNASAATITAAGDTFLSYDDPVKAEAFYLLALTKPGVDSSRVYLRLGIAQADQGKYADAQASFAKVTDARAPIAQLWSAYAKNKLMAPAK